MTARTGMNLRPALKVARELDCSVEHVRRTVEIRVSHPAVERRVVINSRRGSCPRQLSVYLRRVAEAIELAA